MSMLCPVLDTTIATATISGIAAQLGAMVDAAPGAPTSGSLPSAAPRPSYYLFTSSTACWIAQGANPTATVGGAGCMFVPANTPTVIDGKLGAKLSVIQDAAGGKCTLARVRLVS